MTVQLCFRPVALTKYQLTMNEKSSNDGICMLANKPNEFILSFINAYCYYIFNYLSWYISTACIMLLVSFVHTCCWLFHNSWIFGGFFWHICLQWLKYIYKILFKCYESDKKIILKQSVITSGTLSNTSLHYDANNPWKIKKFW